MRKSLIFIFLIIIIFTSCVSEPSSDSNTPESNPQEPVNKPQDTTQQTGGTPPDWILNPYNKYAESDYLATLGEGDTRRDAESNAAAALSRIFQTDVQVDSVAVQRYNEIAKDGGYQTESERDITETVNLQSQQTLINVQYGDVYINDTGRYYIIAYINRSQTAQIYHEKINKNSEAVVNFLNSSNQSSGLLKKYAYIDAAYLFSSNNEMLLNQLSIISPGFKDSISMPYNHNDVLLQRTQIAEEMVFSVSIANDTDSKISNIITDMLSNRGFAVTDAFAPLAVAGNILVEPIQLNNGYENVRWSLTVDLKDETGNILVSINKDQRETSISQAQAIAIAYNEMEELIDSKFMGEFVKYLDSFILQ
jgi:hypothetical protein